MSRLNAPLSLVGSEKLKIPGPYTVHPAVYAPILFDSLASGSLGGLLNTVIINIVNVLSTIIAIVLVDRLGRRVLLLAASAWMFVTQVIVAIVLVRRCLQMWPSASFPCTLSLAAFHWESTLDE